MVVCKPFFTILLIVILLTVKITTKADEENVEGYICSKGDSPQIEVCHSTQDKHEDEINRTIPPTEPGTFNTPCKDTIIYNRTYINGTLINTISQL